MRVITHDVQTEIVVKKSRFISVLTSAGSQEEARALLKSGWNTYPDATHIVYAFRVGKSGDLFGMSDDGEPHGTAGRPVFEVLKGSGITNVVLMVIRYFGGTKLGTGGLVKAYTRAAQEVISLSHTEELTEKTGFRLTVPYQLHDQAKLILQEYSAVITHEDFSTEVVMSGTLPEINLAGIQDRLRDISSGSLDLRVNGREN